MTTQTFSAQSLPVRVPVRALRLLLVRARARRHARRALSEIGVTGPPGRLLAREMARRVRA